jgi:ABC-type Na+ transport system ATPase subunit NatA
MTSTAKIGSIAGTLFYILGWGISIVATNGSPQTTSSLTALCLLPSAAFAQGITQIAKNEGAGIGLSLATMGQGFPMNLQICIEMLVVDLFLYSFLGWYLDQTLPQEFGTREKPWFLFTKAYWLRGAEGGAAGGVAGGAAGGAAEALGAEEREALNQGVEPQNFEGVPGELREQEGAGRCLSICGLRKTFSTPDGQKVAVQGLHLNMYEGQIFALLGHNGAGKTTTISMLCGMYEPTAGDAFVYGQSIKSEMTAIRASLGVCPQHDVLYPNLTVRQHLMVYGGLKGIPDALLELKVRQRVEEVGLTEKMDVRAHALSGGMKRKLSVAITLLADSKMVFMDEPTSGMVRERAGAREHSPHPTTPTPCTSPHSPHALVGIPVDTFAMAVCGRRPACVG